jgi:hypothetical protein
MEKDEIRKTKALMGALLRMPPKPHSEMKLGKPRTKSTSGRKDKSHKKEK